jgi:hypothetical protein
MNMHRGQRIAVGLSVLGLGAVAAIGGGSAAHAQSGSPLLSVYRSVSGSAEQVVISGSGFSPGSSLTIEIVDRMSGAVLATTSLQATAGTAQSGYIREPQLVCGPIAVSPLQGAYGTASGSANPHAIGGSVFAPGGSVTKVAGGNWDFCTAPPCMSYAAGSVAKVAGGNWDSQPPPGTGGNPGLPPCQIAVDSVPQTTYVGGGDIATTVDVASTDSLTVEAIDSASGAVISQVAA